MKHFKILCLLSLLFFSTIYFTSCKNNSNNKNKTKEVATGVVSVDDFEKKLNATKDAQIIDVRTPEEYEGGHLLSAINIDWNGNDFDQKIQALDKTKPTFVYCLSGGRSHEAATQMQKLGFTEIYEMDGGMRAWKKAGKTEITPDKKELTSLSSAEYQKKINSDKLVLVDFNAPWCGPCKTMAPILDELAEEQKAFLELVKINADNNKALTEELKVDGLPTLILYKKGKEVWKHEGAVDKITLMVAIESMK